MLEIIHLWENNSVKFSISLCKYLNYSKRFNANLVNVDLSGINLSYANLSNADLTGANLKDVDLSNANLQNCKLYDANLTGAKLVGANLTEARFENADLEGVEMAGACLMGTVFSVNQINYLKQRYDICRDRVIFNEESQNMRRFAFFRDVKYPMGQAEIDRLLEALTLGELEDNFDD